MADSDNPVQFWMDELGRLPDKFETAVNNIPGGAFAVKVAQKFGLGSTPAQPPDTSWHDQKVREANESYRVQAEKDRQRQAVLSNFRDMAAQRQAGANQ
jgi:hypothetical protein